MLHWYPEDLSLTSTEASSNVSERDAVIVLNGSHSHDATLERRWCSACLKVAVDGGTNHIFDKFGKEKCFWPDVISGDLDSVRVEVLNFYKEQGVTVCYTEDQNYTDFYKCLKLLSHPNGLLPKAVDFSRLVVFGAFGGRLDQTFSNLHVLLTARQFISIPIWLMDERQQAFLLTSGEHKIHVTSAEAVDWCALVPLDQPVCTSTTGLKWNLEEQTMSFAGLISTSNKMVEKEVTVKCDQPLVWMMGY